MVQMEAVHPAITRRLLRERIFKDSTSSENAMAA
jgi:hypothetical protein